MLNRSTIKNDRDLLLDDELISHFEAIEEVAKLTTDLFSSMTVKISECETDYQVRELLNIFSEFVSHMSEI